MLERRKGPIMNASTDVEPIVELVTEQGEPLGAVGKTAAHMPPGQLHRAISVFLLDSSGGLILQKRANSKYHSRGLWSNTCCGHPFPGEQPADAARRRLEDELGVFDADELVAAGTFRYNVSDPASGLIEREFNHVFVGVTAASPKPNPIEVESVGSVGLEDLEAGSEFGPFTPWFGKVLAVARPTIVAIRSARFETILTGPDRR